MPDLSLNAQAHVNASSTLISNSASTAGWRAQVWQMMQARPGLTLAFIAALGSLLILLTQSLYQVWQGQAAIGVGLALAAGTAGFLATAFGALPALVIRQLPQQLEDSLLGFAAGMMLAASAFSLIIPGIAAATTMVDSRALAAGVVVLGMAAGVMLMLGLDHFTPHAHDKSGPCGPAHERCGKVWLFVLAIAIHNLPEGMAMGVSFSQGDMNVGLPLSTAISIQDIPEGLAVALSLRGAGIARLHAVLIAIATGLLEPLGAVLGVSLSGGLALAYPIGLGLAAGAMLFVVSHEVIPETHRNGHQTSATLGLMLGFALMMVLDTSLG